MNIVTMAHGVFEGDQFETILYPADRVLIRVAGEGNVQVAEYHSTDRDAAPQHSHPWDEIEYVIEGEVEFYIKGAWRPVGPGGVQMLPPESPIQ